ncbi:MAG: hypothetical protein U0586_03415 [Candidatus Brocadiaceae bacterium]
MSNKKCLFVLFFVLSLGYSAFTNISSAAWTTTTVDSAGDVGHCTSIALDGAGKAYIGYLDNTNGYLKYATNAFGYWDTQTVDMESAGAYSSLAIDKYDNVHISYYDLKNRDLKYATNATNSWVIRTVDLKGRVGEYSSLAVDLTGHVGISYFDRTNYNLRYANSLVPYGAVNTRPLKPMSRIRHKN